MLGRAPVTIRVPWSCSPGYAGDGNFRQELPRLRAKEHLKFTLYDYEDPAEFAGVDEEWFDGIHMQETNTRQAVEQDSADRGSRGCDWFNVARWSSSPLVGGVGGRAPIEGQVGLGGSEC